MQKISEEHRRRIEQDNPEQVEKTLRAIATINPRRYVCYRTCGPILIDGHLDEPSWKKAPWTELFGQIEEPDRIPHLATRAKMLSLKKIYSF